MLNPLHSVTFKNPITLIIESPHLTTTAMLIKHGKILMQVCNVLTFLFVLKKGHIVISYMPYIFTLAFKLSLFKVFFHLTLDE